MIVSSFHDVRIGTAIVGSGHCVPSRVLTNDDLSRMVETNDEWITTRTGVKQRRLVAEDETSGTLALEASRRALADARLEPRDLDLIICCTLTPEVALPSTASMLHYHLGITGKAIPAFALSAACSGLSFALSFATAGLPVPAIGIPAGPGAFSPRLLKEGLRGKGRSGAAIPAGAAAVPAAPLARRAGTALALPPADAIGGRHGPDRLYPAFAHGRAAARH